MPGLRVRAQRGIRTATTSARPDVVDNDLEVVLGADSYEWHGGREALAEDAPVRRRTGTRHAIRDVSVLLRSRA